MHCCDAALQLGHSTAAVGDIRGLAESRGQGPSTSGWAWTSLAEDELRIRPGVDDLQRWLDLNA
jgi:hypothetical protein